MNLFDPVQDQVEFAAELIRNARHAVALTGAGISTPSGIPDFRSEGTGLWSREEPLEVASLNTFRAHPEHFFSWFRPLAGQIFRAEPNPAHLALAKLQQHGVLRRIITQNIDMLHTKAGSQGVIETHGTLASLSCTHCYQQYGYEEFLPSFVQNGDLPRCPACGAILKPDVILFGEQLPYKALQLARQAVRACDLILVIGSSLEVLPVAGLPMQAIDKGAHLIILNHTPTYLNVRADIVLRHDVVTILPAILRQVLHD